MRRIFFVCLLLCADLFAGYRGTILGSERTRNLRQLDYAPMLFVYHTQTVEPGRHFFTYPQRDTSFRSHFTEAQRRSLVHISDSLGTGPDAHTYAIAASPVLGLDYRSSKALGDTIWPAFDGGLFVRGYADSLDFDLDARIYSEAHSADRPQSYDHEVFDVQKEDRGGLNYVSFARYRAHMGLNYSFARLQLARDVLHFGPGYYNNLTLNQFALPYNMLTLDLTFGPLRVFSAYADLRVNSWSYSKDNLNDRNLYAHRYELALGALSLGVSEIQILYNENKPWLFVPVMPLFIEKGNYTERVNNGAIAFDANYQIFGLARVYGEFFLDDMESPYAVYENKYSNNRWAAMAGIQVAHDFYLGKRRIEAGTIAEISRVEPFTYCHYDTAQAQMAHLGLPVGNPNGPNSLAVDWTLYARLGLETPGREIFAGVHNKWLWKGNDIGSSIDDPYKTVEKRFIHGAPLAYTIAPSVSFHGRHVAYLAEFTFVDEKSAYLRVAFMW